MLFVKLSSHKKVSAGLGCVSPESSLQEPPTKIFAGVGCVSPQCFCRNCPSKGLAGTFLKNRFTKEGRKTSVSSPFFRKNLLTFYKVRGILSLSKGGIF